MPGRLVRRRLRFLLLGLLLLLGAVSGPGTLTKRTSAEETSDYKCLPPKNTDCIEWGCNYKKDCVLSGTNCPTTACIIPPVLVE